MYGNYESNGYKFNSRSAMAEYEMDRRDCDWGPGPQASDYGGYKEEDTSSTRYEQDTSSYHSSHYQRTPKDPKYYHGDREEFDIEHETEKAYLLTNGIVTFWCPKALAIDVIRVRNSIACRIWKGLNRQIIT